jgi:hypothetical protein
MVTLRNNALPAAQLETVSRTLLDWDWLCTVTGFADKHKLVCLL